MSIHIRKGRKGTTIRARGSDAQALFNALCRAVGEPVPPTMQPAQPNDEAKATTQPKAGPVEEVPHG